ncbi:hypothetical protein QAD02_005000 [Eretmocerus hayati]|uniref:Uncharacterized protein n=1 Tax=Eretmocerus hayati TaxID=131215 RepID=A0ACC2NS95_9HYME|nr:hypothetical protein QAD02_005000 [Eretmocerus hayati]
MQENLAAKLCSLLGEQVNQAEQWKLLGQEKDGSLLLTWVESGSSPGGEDQYSVIGKYDRAKDILQVLHKFPKALNLVQASVNQSSSVLGYVVKQKCNSLDLGKGKSQLSSNCEKSDDNEKDAQPHDTKLEYYQANVIELKTKEKKILTLEDNKSKQVRIQFLYKEKSSRMLDKLLVLVHQEYVKMCTILYDTTSEEHSVGDVKSETLVKTFIWAQWDAVNQVLYHIHNRKALASLFNEDAADKSPKPSSVSPMLSGFQFHDDLPHETVLNIPLNLPQAPSSEDCGTYEDDVIPLRIHDCSLDLIVISDRKGAVCICHHYLYRPVQPPQHILDSALSDSNTVHFAYSVTLLHQSCVIHCVIPGIPWARVKLMKPTFTLYGDNHMIVFVQDFFTHLLEIGFHHQPCCHVLTGPLPNVPPQSSYLVPLLSLKIQNETTSNIRNKHSLIDSNRNSTSSSSNSIVTVDLPTLDLVDLSVPTNFLIDVFKKETNTDVRLGILHYFLSHENDMELVSELLSTIVEKPRSLDIVKILQEFLISGSHCLVQRNLLSDALPLLAYIPVTTVDECSKFDTKINDFAVTLNHEKLLNTSVMLLSPQQRLVPYRSDLWTKLWDLLSKRSDELPRFKPSQVAEKLLLSLACYQPEALSRCSTPMSPGAGFTVTTSTLGELMGGRHGKCGPGGDPGLPFIELESCTASKQEHIVSVNLREISVHLMRHGAQGGADRGVPRPGSCTPLHVHAMSTRYVASQLEISRLLCQMLSKVAGVDPRHELERGFCLVDQLEDSRRWLLFTLLERYRYATESIAFPVPQGFMSFFTYLGYRTLKYSKFLQYVQRSVFELQVDVAKVIMSDIGDTKENVPRKLELLSLLPRSRAKRLLNQWLHPMSFMIRAREHAANILSGEQIQSRNRHSQHRVHHNGLSAFPSSDRLSPLDTFLDLLTAKASLTELDFGLLIEATVTSTEDFL